MATLRLRLISIAADRCTSLMLRWLVRSRPLPIALAVLVALAALAGLPRAEAQPVSVDDVIERQVKAAYLSKFGSYVEWPPQTFASPESPLRIGIIGADMMADDLAQMLAGRTVNGRQVTVRKLRREDSFDGLNILFIGRSNNNRLADILATTKTLPILTVTESDEALALGSTINFVIVNGRVRFEVAPKTAGQGQLNISARLLAAAYKVAQGAS